MHAQMHATGNMIDYTPAAALSAGDVVVMNDRMCAVATRDIAAGALGALAIEGIFKIEKENVAFVAGQDVYWDEGNDRAIASGGAYFGKAVPKPDGTPDVAASATDDHVYVKLLHALDTDYGTATGTGTGPDDA